jgi:hypothetical protein
MKDLNKNELIIITGGSGTEGMNTIQKGYYYFVISVAIAKGWLDKPYDRQFGDSLPIENKA